MVETTRTSKLAVIITTHYIEEARQANLIGMMRNGILLAEDTPTNILQKYGCDNLEDAFLVLCQKHGKSEEADTTLGRVGGQRYLSSSTSASTMTNEMSANDSSSGAQRIDDSKSMPPTATAVNAKPKLKPNMMFDEKQASGWLDKLSFTTQIRMKALLTKNLIQLIRQPS